MNEIRKERHSPNLLTATKDEEESGAGAGVGASADDWGPGVGEYIAREVWVWVVIVQLVWLGLACNGGLLSVLRDKQWNIGVGRAWSMMRQQLTRHWRISLQPQWCCPFNVLTAENTPPLLPLWDLDENLLLDIGVYVSIIIMQSISTVSSPSSLRYSDRLPYTVTNLEQEIINRACRIRPTEVFDWVMRGLPCRSQPPEN